MTCPLTTKVKLNRFKSASIEWIVCLHLAFAVVESEYFRTFLEICSLAAVTLLPRDGETIRNWVTAAFQNRKQQVKAWLHQTHGLVHLSFDLWTSPNHLAMVGIIGHWFDGQIVQTTLLGLHRIRGSRPGENIAESVIAIIQDYDLTKRLRYFVLDNADTNDTNDTYVATVLATLCPDLRVKQRRLRCLGHIIDLAAQALLFGDYAEAFTI